ncbi:hypothetical protein SAMN05444411_101245 [Lutibacter oricola]|uniref:Uncharacterized protein n=1 Tax=Lutibacter oricola TaxID=762486 RepID=A0A1H2RHJ6_9FLAO|nr:hypothetical protein [Lutibacter oricola]SDW18932.1 hypothetical protein SAMN05444411_101245 [Lutibacter oricola]
MSFGAGSIPGYLERLLKSKNRRTNHQKEFKGGNDYSNVKSVKTEYNLPKISKYNLAELKIKLRFESLQNSKKQQITWALGFVVLLILFLIFNFY